jgi:hypothetical protein
MALRILHLYNKRSMVPSYKSLQSCLCGALAVCLLSAAAPATQTPAQAWVNSLALQAATFGAPIVAMYNLRSTVSFGANPAARPNEIWRLENIATPAIAQQLGYVTPNVDVIYGFGFMDLAQQPIILTVPNSHGRYYMVQIVDMWTNAFAYVGGTATGYKGGTYALVAPGWHGSLPAHVKRINASTRWVELQPRVYVKDTTDLAAARIVLDGIRVEGLAQYEGQPEPKALAYRYPEPKINPGAASSMMQFTDPMQFWEILSAAMNENPPPKREIETTLPQYGYLGITLGKQWMPASVSPAVREQMARAASDIGPMLSATASFIGNVANGWVIPPPNIGSYGGDYVTRAVVAVIGLTSNTPSEAIYYQAYQDANGQPLTGGKRYAITFRPPMPYLAVESPGFWSMTMYDAKTSYTVPNAVNRYALGSKDSLRQNTDGSFTIYVQHDSPSSDKASNWLPSPGASFYLTLRVYAPNPSLTNALGDFATFQGPPPIVPEQ